jgi:hypothetical protein
MRYFTLFILMQIFSSFAQTDFAALKQQFLDYRKADKQDSALFIARKMNQLALKEQTDTSYWYALSMRYMGNPHDNSEIQSFNFLAIYPKCMDTIIYVWDPEERIPKYWDDINYSKKILLEASIKSGCNELIVGKTYLGWHSNRGMVSELYYYPL